MKFMTIGGALAGALILLLNALPGEFEQFEKHGVMWLIPFAALLAIFWWTWDYIWSTTEESVEETK